MYPTNDSSFGQFPDSNQGPEAPLDTIANFPSPCPHPTSIRGSGSIDIQQYFDAVFSAYRLHSHVRNIWLTKDARRVRACHWNQQSCQQNDVVEVYRDESNSRAMYERLQTCASVWSCPICAPKIAVRRSDEMRIITDWARSNGFRILFITLTSRHNLEDRLKHLLELQKIALDEFRSGKRNLKKITGYKYWIRAREITIGASGWHPHYHELIFTENGRDVDELADEVFSLWRDMSVNAGLAVPVRRAFNLTDSDEKIAEYIAKYGKEPRWTEAEEVTLGLRKKSRGAGLSPWGLLEKSFGGDHIASARWCEYSEAVKQLNQLRCSNGLKLAAGLKEKTNEELVKEEGEAVRRLFATIPTSVWEIVRRRWRAHLLQVAATGNHEGFNDLLAHAVVKHYHPFET